MSTVIALAGLCLAAPGQVQDMKPWKPYWELEPWVEYQKKVDAAYMVELTWTASLPIYKPPTPVDPKKGVEPPPKVEYEKHSYRLLLKGKNQISLEEPGVERTVWRDGKGVRLGLKEKEYEPLIEFPKFEPAKWFRLSALRPEPFPADGTKHPSKVLEIESNGVKWSVVRWMVNLLDAFAEYDFWFDPGTQLMRQWTVKFWGMWDRTARNQSVVVEKFDLTALLSDADFSLEPPAGFVRKRQDQLQGGQNR